VSTDPLSTGPAENLLEVRGLATGHGDLRVVWDVSLTVRPGRITALLGRNGAGKTTTLRAIAGLNRAMAGDILLRGEQIGGLPAHRQVRRGIALSRHHRTISSGSGAGAGGVADEAAGGTTNATTTTPRRSSGTPTTAASLTPGWSARTCSTSAGYTLNPPTTTMSLARPTMLDVPVVADPADVTGAEPAIVHDLGRGRGIVQVTDHNVRAAHLDLAGLARSGHAHLHAVDRGPHGLADQLDRVAAARHHAHPGGLGESVRRRPTRWTRRSSTARRGPGGSWTGTPMCARSW
jgi:energy-coupling factor transporter ATP-binding protein EcfA2